jgi:DNA mismatch endonuclease (patch repair protein)
MQKITKSRLVRIDLNRGKYQQISLLRAPTMTDVFTRQKRSQVMSRIRGKDTKPEIVVRRYLHGLGFRFRQHKKGIPGRPDLWLPKYNAAIFVNGCYWHRHPGCKLAYTPKQNRTFWEEKFESNVVRDKENLSALKAQGIRVLVVWECQLKSKATCQKTLPKISNWLLSDRNSLEIPRSR